MSACDESSPLGVAARDDDEALVQIVSGVKPQQQGRGGAVARLALAGGALLGTMALLKLSQRPVALPVSAELPAGAALARTDGADGAVASEAAPTTLALGDVVINNEWERSVGRRIGEGYNFGRVVEMYRPTRLAVEDASYDDSAYEIEWTIIEPTTTSASAEVAATSSEASGAVSVVSSSSSKAAVTTLYGPTIEHTFTHVGSHRVVVKTVKKADARDSGDASDATSGASGDVTSDPTDSGADGSSSDPSSASSSSLAMDDPVSGGAATTDDDDEYGGDDAYSEMVLTAKYVRRNIYDLSHAERESFFDSLKTVYTVGGDEGRRKYGSKYRSIQELVADHLDAAADKECDHWHDDAGFMVHHVAFTLVLEQSLQAVDSTMTVPYWDYTQDEYLHHSDWTGAQIFDDGWFGAASPNNDKHVIDAGRWAYTPIAREASNYTRTHNPYGLLRSPWNTNPTPFLTRFRYTVGQKDAGYNLPSCQKFKTSYNAMWVGLLNTYLNGYLHGEVHIMLGGHWDFGPNLTTVGNGSQSMLLSSKALWRQGFLRCPEYCSQDTPSTDCTCSCPESLREEAFGESVSSHELMERTGLFTWNSEFMDGWKEAFGIAHHDAGSWDDVLDAICHVGHAGEMFTSAAPYDPMFWPLHGIADRFLMLKRLRYYEKSTELEETWGYDHALVNVASDTHLVCDWDRVDQGVATMPACDKGTCAGHRADDLLPFGDFLDTGDTYTNYEFYEFMSPENDEFPYVYDSLVHWPGCSAQGISFGTSGTDDDATVVTGTSSSSDSPAASA